MYVNVNNIIIKNKNTKLKRNIWKSKNIVKNTKKINS